MKPDQPQVENLIEFRIKTGDKERMIILDPSKLDSFKQMVADLRGFAQDEAEYNTRMFLLHVAGMVEYLAKNLFTVNHHNEPWSNDWIKVIESILRTLAEAVNQKFYPVSDQPTTADIVFGRW